MAPLKKRNSIRFLDSSDDEESKNLMASDDLASDSDSAYDDDDDNGDEEDYDDHVDNDEQYVKVNNRRNSKKDDEKKSTPTMIDSPSFGDEDEHFEGGEEEENDEVPGILHHRQEDIHGAEDSLAKAIPTKKSKEKVFDTTNNSMEETSTKGKEANESDGKQSQKSKLNLSRAKKKKGKQSKSTPQVQSLKVIVDQKVIQDSESNQDGNTGNSNEKPIVLDSDDEDENQVFKTSPASVKRSSTSKRKKIQSTSESKSNHKSNNEEDDIVEKSPKKPKATHSQDASKESSQHAKKTKTMSSKSSTITELKQSQSSSGTVPSKLPPQMTSSKQQVPIKPLSQNSTASSISTSTANTNTNSSKPSSRAIAKPKKKKQTLQSQVLSHLLKTLKPFTLKSLASELRTTSIALNHLMLSLVDKKIVYKKIWGKNQNKELYYIDIDNAMKAHYGNDYHIDSKAKDDAKNELKMLEREEMMIHNEINRLNTQLSNEELEKQLQEQEQIANELKSRIDGAKERIANNNNDNVNNAQAKKQLYACARGGNQLINNYKQQKSATKTTKQIKREINDMRMEWKSRKEKCIDFIDNLSDAMEKKPKDIIKLLDIETDESVGAKLPPKHTI